MKPAVILGIIWSLSLSLTAQVTSPSALDQRIQRIKDQLLPAVVIDNQPAGSKLAERMAELRVPGVSIAVIHDGAIEWARGFGVIRIGGPAVKESPRQTSSIKTKDNFSPA